MKIHLYLEISLSSVQTMIDANKQFDWVLHSELAKEPDTKNLGDEDLSYFLIAPTGKVDQHIPEFIPLLVERSNVNPEKTLYSFIREHDGAVFSQHQSKSLDAIGKMIESNQAHWLKTLPLKPTDWPAVLGTLAL